MRVAYNPQLPAAPILVGSDKGYFREQGIEIETERAENAAAVFQALAPGDHVLAPRVMYWALRNWLVTFAARWGLAVDLVDMDRLEAVRAAIRPGRTKLVWIETPANPTWIVTDIAAVAEI